MATEIARVGDGLGVRTLPFEVGSAFFLTPAKTRHETRQSQTESELDKKCERVKTTARQNKSAPASKRSLVKTKMRKSQNWLPSKRKNTSPTSGPVSVKHRSIKGFCRDRQGQSANRTLNRSDIALCAANALQPVSFCLLRIRSYKRTRSAKVKAG